MCYGRRYHGFGCGAGPVSYTHLDVYKRQFSFPGKKKGSAGKPMACRRWWFWKSLLLILIFVLVLLILLVLAVLVLLVLVIVFH